MLRNFLFRYLRLQAQLEHEELLPRTAMAEIRQNGGQIRKVILGLSGGVDSSVRRYADPQSHRPSIDLHFCRQRAAAQR